jgi:transposase-like protein
VDETYVRIRGHWFYFYRALDSSGATIDFFPSAVRSADAAKALLSKSLSDPSNIFVISIALGELSKGYETIHKIRKGQVRWLRKGDVRVANQFIDRIFGLTA